MGSVVAKFELSHKTEYKGGSTGIFLSAVQADDFTQYTPSGKIEMSISDKGRAAAEFFKAGKKYKVTFEEVED